MEKMKPRIIRKLTPVTHNGNGGTISDSMLDITDFLEEKFPHRPFIIDPWLREGTIALVFAHAGTGKTWFTMSLAVAITRGLSIGEWKNAKPISCLYIDGEMSCEEFQERLKKLTKYLPPAQANLSILSFERMKLNGDSIPNLAEQKWRDDLYNTLKHDRSIKLVIIDNLSCIISRISENSKQQWDDINQWLLSIRRLGVAVIMVHHTGKNGRQRGTSAREDNIDVSISLTQVNDYQRKDGAKFKVNFLKARGIRGYAASTFNMEIVEGGEGKLPWKTNSQQTYGTTFLLDD